MIKFGINVLRLKTVTMIVFLLSIFSCTIFQKELDKTILLFNKSNHDLGEIKHGGKVSTTFNFTNIGENELVIYDIKTSCGCTVPEWNKGTIEKGNKGEIKVVYEAERIGVFSATIYVHYNGLDSPQKLYLKGEIEYLSLVE